MLRCTFHPLCSRATGHGTWSHDLTRGQGGGASTALIFMCVRWLLAVGTQFKLLFAARQKVQACAFFTYAGTPAYIEAKYASLETLGLRILESIKYFLDLLASVPFLHDTWQS